MDQKRLGDLQEGWEGLRVLPERREGSGGRGEYGGPSGWPGKAERPFRKGQEELGGPSGEPGEVGRAGRRWEALLEGWEVSGGPSREVGGVGRAGRGWEALP